MVTQSESDKIVDQVYSIIQAPDSRDKKLKKVCQLLDREVDVFNWTGFYLVSEEEKNILELGAYVGEPTDHTRIPFGKGICGQAAETLETFVVQDVNEADNYLACSVDVQSEIVVPILKEGKFVGELDIDSHTKDAIVSELRELCEKVAKEVSRLF